MAVPAALTELVAQQLQQFGIVIDDQQPARGSISHGVRVGLHLMGGWRGMLRQSRYCVVALVIPRSRERLALQRRSGFVMPLAMTASAVLLLGSASIHTLSLQGHWRHQASLHRLKRWISSSPRPRPLSQVPVAGRPACCCNRPTNGTSPAVTASRPIRIGCAMDG